MAETPIEYTARLEKKLRRWDAPVESKKRLLREGLARIAKKYPESSSRLTLNCYNNSLDNGRITTNPQIDILLEHMKYIFSKDNNHLIELHRDFEKAGIGSRINPPYSIDESIFPNQPNMFPSNVWNSLKNGHHPQDPPYFVEDGHECDVNQEELFPRYIA